MTLRSGEAYDEVTEQALKSARAVVVLWSKRSVDSRWVRAEATLADRNRTLVPATIEACDLPIMFELTQTADLSHWRGEAGDAAWRAFLGDVRRIVGAKAAGRAATVAAAGAAHATPPHAAPASLAILPFTNRSGERGRCLRRRHGGGPDRRAVAQPRDKVIAASATAALPQGRAAICADRPRARRALSARRQCPARRRTCASPRKLVEAEDGEILWTQKFDRPLPSLPTLQEELVTEVAAISASRWSASKWSTRSSKPATSPLGKQ